MIFWIFIAAVTALVVALLLLPLFTRGGEAISRSARELAIYKDQLAELQRERAAGRISPAEVQGAEAEIQRKMLASAETADSADGSSDSAGAGAAKLAATAVVASLVPMGALLVYLSIGSPDAPGFPFDPSRQASPAVAEHGDAEIEAMVTTLAERMKQDPNNLDGWILLAKSYAAISRHADAAQAYERVYALSNQNGAYAGDYAEALVLAAGGQVVPLAHQLFSRIVEGNPGEPRARYYLALALAQSGKARDAIAMWRGLEADSPPDAPWLPAVREVVQMVASEAGIDPASVPPTSRAAIEAPPGPTAEDLAAAQAMSPDDQQQMIQDMVARLAERLESEPNDIEGWLRLARSYTVLGEQDRAAEALQRAAAVTDAPPESKAQVAATARELGIDLDSGTSAPTTAPATTDGASDQAAMIRAMVDGLAQRLQSNPDDLEGWRRLGKSYLILGEPIRAQEAYSRALELAPTDLEILTGYAQSTMLASGTIAVPKESIETLRNLLGSDDGNGTALWLMAAAESKAGNNRDAEKLLQRLLRQLQPESPAHGTVKARLDALGQAP